MGNIWIVDRDDGDTGRDTDIQEIEKGKGMKKLIMAWATAAAFLAACVKEKPLPFYGERDFDGKDTIYHTIPHFSLVNQDSVVVNNDTFKGKIYVADFFFTTCPDICPKMKTQMLRVYEKFKDDPEILLLSHTIDPEHDNVNVLREYGEAFGVSSSKWHFVTGSMDSIYQLAEKGYFSRAAKDSTAAGGFLHNGAFVLIDKQQRIRGLYDGTKEEPVDKLMKDIDRLKRESE
jgi:protein SCO1